MVVLSESRLKSFKEQAIYELLNHSFQVSNILLIVYTHMVSHQYQVGYVMY